MIKRFRDPLKAWAVAAALAAAAWWLCAVCACAMPMTLYESKEETIITRGATLEKARRLTADGWLSYDVIRVDLTDRYLSLDAIYDQTSLTALKDVSSRAREAGAVAAVNGAYFSGYGSGGVAIGTMMRNGSVDTADCVTNINGDVIGSITVDRLNNILFGYVNPTITLYGAGGAAVWADMYNKPNTANGYAGFTILDRKHTKYSVGASEKYPDIVELVVQGGAVREIREAMPAIEIPVDGFVVVARASLNADKLMADAFKPGSPCRFEVKLTPTLDGAAFHMDGTSMLVAGGRIPGAFSYNPADIAKRNPRTMVGLTKDKKQFIIVVVDGRQSQSIGLDTYEAAEFMLSLGAWDALNLDGGGSSAMVARDPSANALRLVNSPSDGSQRKVVNALGVFTSAPKAAVGRIEIEAESFSVFAGATRRFAVKAYDRYDNPTPVNPADIVWSTKGIRGSIDGGVLRPAAACVGAVRARVGRVRAEVEVRCLEAPAQLILDSGREAALEDGAKRAFKVTGKTNAGFSAPIDAKDVMWAVAGGIGSFVDGVFSRVGTGSGYITAAFGGARAYCAVRAPGGAGGSGGAGAGSGAGAVDIPADTRIVDPAGRAVDYIEGPKSFRFAVFGTHTASSMESALARAQGGAAPADAAAAKKAEDERKSRVAALVKSAGEAFADKVNKYIDIAVYAGFGEHPGAGAVSKRVVETDYSFDAYGPDTNGPDTNGNDTNGPDTNGNDTNGADTNGADTHGADTHGADTHSLDMYGGSESRIIKVSTAGDGILAAGPTQWRALISELSSFSGKNLFVVMQQSPSTFKDKLEQPLLRSLLSKYSQERGYDAYVIYSGSTDSVWIEDGVRYFSVAGLQSSDLAADKVSDTNYLLVTVIGDEVTYAYRKLVG